MDPEEYEKYEEKVWERILKGDDFWDFLDLFEKYLYRGEIDGGHITRRRVLIQDPVPFAATFFYCYDEDKKPSRQIMRDLVDYTNSLIRENLESQGDIWFSFLEDCFNAALEEFRAIRHVALHSEPKAPLSDVEPRRKIVRSLMRRAKDFYNPENVKRLFKTLDEKGIGLPDPRKLPPAEYNWAKKWIDLVEKPKSEIYHRRIQGLVRDRFNRSSKKKKQRQVKDKGLP